MSGATPPPCYAFEITLHGRPEAVAALEPGPIHRDLGCSWPTVIVPRSALSDPLAVGFDDALAGLGALDRMFAEPDGALVWTSDRDGVRWQVDGNASEKEGRVLLVDLKGACPPEDFDRLLACFGWPAQRLLMQLVRAGVFLEEETFRRHATARGIAGDGETLRPR